MLEFGKRKIVAAPLMFVILLMFAELKATQSLTMENETKDDEETELTWKIFTDNVAAYSLLSNLDLELLIEENDTKPERVKRSSFTTTYNQVPLETMNTIPYNAAVRISSSCTGTLISDRHVLTAAHCIYHKKSKYRPFKSKITVEIPKASGKFDHVKVLKVHAPEIWKRYEKAHKPKHYVDQDYAVLELKNPVYSTYLTPQKSRGVVGSGIQYNGYPSRSHGRMWHSSCRINKVHNKYTFLSICGASFGTSGSGIYHSIGAQKYAVTAVVSAKVTIKKGRYSHSFVVINKLTRHKVHKICRWAKRQDCQTG